MYTVLLVIHTIVVLFLIVMVLIQRTDSDGLGGLSGGGGNQFMTGRATANLLTRTTAILAGVFMITSLLLAVMASHMTSTSIMDTAIPAVESKTPLSKNNEAPATPTAIPGKQDVIEATKPAKPVAKTTPMKPAPAATAAPSTAPAPSVPKAE